MCAYTTHITEHICSSVHTHACEHTTHMITGMHMSTLFTSQTPTWARVHILHVQNIYSDMHACVQVYTSQWPLQQGFNINISVTQVDIIFTWASSGGSLRYHMMKEE